MDGDGGRRDAPGALMEAGRGTGSAGMAEPRARAARLGPQRFLRRSVVESDQEEPPGLEAAETPSAQPPQPLQRRVLLLCKTRRLIAERARCASRLPECPLGPWPGASGHAGAQPRSHHRLSRSRAGPRRRPEAGRGAGPNTGGRWNHRGKAGARARTQG